MTRRSTMPVVHIDTARGSLPPTRKKPMIVASALHFMALAWTVQASAMPITFTASGANAAGIQSSVDSFRAALGNPDNVNGGPQATGHREINWDGGGATNGTAAVTPFTVFQKNRRGICMNSPDVRTSDRVLC